MKVTQLNLSLFSFQYKMYPKNSIIWKKSPHNIFKIIALKVSFEYIYLQLSIVHTTRKKLNYSMYKSRETG